MTVMHMFGGDVVYFQVELDINCSIETERVKHSAKIEGELSFPKFFSEIVTDHYLNCISGTFRTVYYFQYLFLFFDYLQIF